MFHRVVVNFINLFKLISKKLMSHIIRVLKLQTLGLISVQLDPGLPDRQKSGGQHGQHHLISPDPQHWCTAGLHPQPTLVLTTTVQPQTALM